MILFSGIDEIVSMQEARQKMGRHIKEKDLSIIKKGVLLVDPKTGKLMFVGKRQDLPKRLYSKVKKEISLGGSHVFPGFIECHTHSLFAGNRVQEFEARNQGISYQEIAKKGGGILSTLRDTRDAKSTVLKDLLIDRLNRFAAQGVTCVEIKTGYALDEANELRQLKLLASFSDKKFAQLPEVVSTYLGGHAIPPEFSDASSYIEFVTQKMFPQIKRWTNRVDIFVEKGFFDLSHGRQYAEAATQHGLKLTIHADQLSNSGGAELAIEAKALSADHLLQIDSSLIQELAKSEVTCVGLPLADLYMKCHYPPLRALCDAGARVAISTDFNPGTSPSQDVTLTGLLARLQCGLSLPETLSAYTVGPSYALGLEDRKACLSSGYDADFFSADSSWDQLFYSPGKSMNLKVFRAGKLISGSISN